jgi:hypothetical protein
MAEPLPRWAMRAYSKLWAEFKSSEFDYNAATKVLHNGMTSVVLSRLKKNGWLEVKLDPIDSRKRVYKLKTPEEALKEIANSEEVISGNM